MESNPKSYSQNRKYIKTLIFSAFIAGLCSIIYELLIATSVSYFLGDSIKYFSITIGVYMAAMGIGSFISKYITGNILQKFIIIEISLGLIGGLSIPILYLIYAFADSIFIFSYIIITILIGIFIGLEIPFLTRLMDEYKKLKVNIANILSFDYLGALIATISFPFILLPIFGVFQSSLIFGLVNMSIGFAILFTFQERVGNNYKNLIALNVAATLLMLLTLFFSAKLLKEWDNRLYEDRIVYNKQTKYQKIVLTKNRNDVRLFLNGNLQFSSIDEYRYHESLVHIPLLMTKTQATNILVLGAGDGMAIRELLKHNNIDSITLVDLDKDIVNLAKNNHHITKINNNSLQENKVQFVFQDAFSFLLNNKNLFDFIIADLPDPNNNSLARLYTKQFYKLIKKNLTKNGIFVTQATSPYFAPKAFWTINKTLQSANFKHTLPYSVEIPSFGQWGFIFATNSNLEPIDNLNINIETNFLDKKIIPQLFTFSKDIRSHNKEVTENLIDKPHLLQHYLSGWSKFAY